MIEDLKSKEDLARFIEETVRDLPLNAIKGLPAKLAAIGKLQILDFGTVDLEFPAGGGFSSEVEVEHQLGDVPVVILPVGADRVVEAGYHSKDADSFVIWGWSDYEALAEGSYEVSWVAMR